MFKYIQILENFQKDKLCIYVNYDIDIRDINKNTIIRDISYELYSVYTHYNVKKQSVIIMVDFNKINKKNTNNIDLILLHKLSDMVQNLFPDMLYKLIIYDYSLSIMYLIKILKNFFDNETKEKIIISKELKPFIELLINNNKDINEKGINILNNLSYSFKDNITVSNNL